MLCWWRVFFNALPHKCISVLALMRGIGVLLLGGRIKTSPLKSRMSKRSRPQLCNGKGKAFYTKGCCK